VHGVLEDFRSAPISEEDKALFAFLEKVNRQSNTIAQEDVDDAITVCALFNFYNVWVDATGVHDMPAEAYSASGERLAAMGYVVE